MPGSITIARILGIQVRVHASWLLIAALVLFTFENIFSHVLPTTRGERWVAAVAASLLFFLSVLLHELSHSVVARAFRLPVSSITLFVFGGVANLRREPESARSEFLVAAVGPATSVGLAAIAWVLWLALSENIASIPALITAAVLEQISQLNLLLAAFNLLPGFPLDGGRVLRSVLWGVFGDRRRATRVATRGGQIVAALLVVLGLVQLWEGQFVPGTWSMLIAFFLYNAATASYRQEAFDDSLRRVQVRTLMTPAAPTVPADLPLSTFVSTYALPLRGRSFLAERGGWPVGIITVADVRRVPRDTWERRRVAEVAVPLDRVPAVSPDDDARTAFERLGRGELAALPVTDGGLVVGIFERDAIAHYLQMREELGV